MLQVQFDQEAIEALKYERLRHPHPRVQQKMWAVWLKSCNVPHCEISRFVDISENTVRAYLEEFVEGGIEALKVVPFEGTRSQLDAHQSTLEDHLREHPPASAGEARAEIARLTGIERCPTQVREFMHRIGMKFRKVAAVPAKVDPVAQEEFKKNFWSQDSKRRNKGPEKSTL